MHRCLDRKPLMWLNLEWHYKNGFVNVTMKDYVCRNLSKFKHVPSKKTQYSPHPWHAPVYGRKTSQQPTAPSTAPLLYKSGTRRIQAISGTFLYYSKIDMCIKTALNEIPTKKSAPTEDTNQNFLMLMYYLHQYPYVNLWYHASDMFLNCKADSSYLVLPTAQSRAAAWFILSNKPNNHGNFMQNAPTYTYNSTVKLILTSSMRQELSKAFDMHFYWVRDCIKQKKIDIIWRKVKTNKVDYFNKHHPPWNHKKMWYQYLHKALISQLSLHAHSLWGCVTPTTVPLYHSTVVAM